MTDVYTGSPWFVPPLAPSRAVALSGRPVGILKMMVVGNAGTATMTVNGVAVRPGSQRAFWWDGHKWRRRWLLRLGYAARRCVTMRDYG